MLLSVANQSFVRITSNGKVKGDITVKTLVIDEDAFFEGNCKMLNATEASE